MNVSTRTRYALRMLVDIAAFQDSGKVKIRDISVRQDISVKYLEQIVTLLKRKAGVGVVVPCAQIRAGQTHVAEPRPIGAAPEGMDAGLDLQRLHGGLVVWMCVPVEHLCGRPTHDLLDRLRRYGL